MLLAPDDTDLFCSSQENVMKIIADYGKFGTFKSLLQVTLIT